MPRQIEPAPIRKSILVRAAPAHAFAVFTAGIDRWWPRTANVGASPIREVILEGRAGGRWYCIGEDGTQTDTGRVLVWDPPVRLVLDWQIGLAWAYDPDFHTDIEVLFRPEGDGFTRVDFEHRDLGRYRDQAGDVVGRIQPGWARILDLFAGAASIQDPHP